MSIFNILPLQKIFKGCIKVNDNHFGFFSVNYKKVTLDLSQAFDVINQNLRKKKFKGNLLFCKFEDHDGKHTFNSTKLAILILMFRSSHFSVDGKRTEGKLYHKHIKICREKRGVLPQTFKSQEM